MHIFTHIWLKTSFKSLLTFTTNKTLGGFSSLSLTATDKNAFSKGSILLV